MRTGHKIKASKIFKMKNKNKFTKSLIHFVKSELEVTLAVLVLLAFVIGYSFAQTPQVTPTPDMTAQQTAEESANFVIGGKEYTGLSFHKRISGFYRVTNISGGALNVSPTGLTTVEDGDYYATINLDVPLATKDKWYADVDGAFIEINGQRLTSNTQPINIEGAKSIQIHIRGYATLRTISHTIPSPTQTVVTPTVGSLYIAPTVTTLIPNSTRTFLLVAVDTTGNTISTDGAKWSSSNPGVVEINATTGMVTARAEGTVVVTATLGTAKASATVTVKAAEEAVTNCTTCVAPQPTTAPATNTPTTSTTTNPTDDAVTSLFKSPTDTQPASAAVDEAVNSLFNPEIVAARAATTGKTHATQKEINEAAAQLPTLTQKVTFRLKTAVNDIATSLREMVVGYEISDENGNVQKKPGVFQTIGNLIGRLIGDPRAGGASTLKMDPHGDIE